MRGSTCNVSGLQLFGVVTLAREQATSILVMSQEVQAGMTAARRVPTGCADVPARTNA